MLISFDNDDMKPSKRQLFYIINFCFRILVLVVKRRHRANGLFKCPNFLTNETITLKLHIKIHFDSLSCYSIQVTDS